MVQPAIAALSSALEPTSGKEGPGGALYAGVTARIVRGSIQPTGSYPTEIHQCQPLRFWIGRRSRPPKKVFPSHLQRLPAIT